MRKMCEFISWIKTDDGDLVYMTDKDLDTSRGRRLVRDSGRGEDVLGHGFLKQYMDLDEDTSYDENEVDLQCETLKDLPVALRKVFATKASVKKNFGTMMEKFVDESTLAGIAGNTGLPSHIREVAIDALVKTNGDMDNINTNKLSPKYKKIVDVSQSDADVDDED
jgi:hypothetical protein